MAKSASSSPPPFLHLHLAATPVATSTSVQVAPVACLAVLDHFVRRQEGSKRVVGALLGHRLDTNEDDDDEFGGADVDAVNSLEGAAAVASRQEATAVRAYNMAVNNRAKVVVTNCFPLSFEESEDSVGVDPDYLQQMYSLHQRANPNEIIVGWYATGNVIDANSALIHEFFCNETYPYQPVHVLIDTGFNSGSMSVKAMVSSANGVPGSEFSGSMFLPVPCSVKFSAGDRSGLDLISSSKGESEPETASLMSDMSNLERSILLIQDLLETVSAYVDKVKKGEIDANNAVGRYLMDTIGSIPRIDSAAFEKMFNKHLQDMLMVVYLANLTRTQLAIAERLHHLV